MWWPNIRKDIEGYVNECGECNKARHTRYYPLKLSALPRGPWQTVGADLCKFNRTDSVILVYFFTVDWID